MKPIKFKPLPTFVNGDEGLIIHCWQLDIKERIKILFTGKLWIKVFNFNRPPQPIEPMVDNPFQSKNSEETR